MSEPAARDPDLHDRRRSVLATGVLRRLNDADVLQSPDVQVATRLSAIARESDDTVRLAIALTVRGVRGGSVCVDLAELAQTPEADGVAWPSAGPWLEAVRASPLVATGVLRLEGSLLYLDRYWREEGLIAALLRERVRRDPPAVVEPVLTAGADRVFGPGHEEQRAASVAAARRWTSLVTGGPGTGKTTAVAGLLALLTEQAAHAGTRPPRIALTAPTGKAAARLHEAVAGATARLPAHDRDRLGTIPAQTLHRLLGSRPGSRTRFRHDRDNRLPHDVVVVDETSMVSLTMMARLLEALRPDARLVLVGDPDQLSSVEAGAVLSDLVGGFAAIDPGAVGALHTSHRFGAGIGALAAAVRDGDADATIALLRAGASDVVWLDPGDASDLAEVRRVVLGASRRMLTAAEAGDHAQALELLDEHRLLTAHRDGPHGAAHWNRQVERWLTEATGLPIGPAWGRDWYAGRPLIVTANDYGIGLFNGDTGVAVAAGEHLRAAVATPGAATLLAASRLTDVETMHALTIHRSQGSQAREVTVALPSEDSRLLTRELFYTALTRAQERVRVLATEASVRLAVERRARRASGLRERLAAE